MIHVNISIQRLPAARCDRPVPSGRREHIDPIHPQHTQPVLTYVAARLDAIDCTKISRRELIARLEALAGHLAELEDGEWRVPLFIDERERDVRMEQQEPREIVEVVGIAQRALDPDRDPNPEPDPDDDPPRHLG